MRLEVDTVIWCHQLEENNTFKHYILTGEKLDTSLGYGLNLRMSHVVESRVLFGIKVANAFVGIRM